MKTVSGVEYSVRLAGTEDCEVRLRLSKEQMRLVKKYFGFAEDDRLFWTTAEVASQGNGWYCVWGMNGVVDGALIGLRHIEMALQRKVRPSKAELPVVSEQSYVVRNRGVRGRPVVISRAKQARDNKSRELMDMFREAVSRIPPEEIKPHTTPSAAVASAPATRVSDLATHFNTLYGHRQNRSNHERTQLR